MSSTTPCPAQSSGGGLHPTLIGQHLLRGVRLNLLHPNPQQPRKELDERPLRELMASIQANGLLQPILVRRGSAGPPDHFTIIAGHRRVEAYRRLKEAASTEELRSRYSTIPAWEYPSGLSCDDALLALVENVQRADLSPLEEAEGLIQIQELRPELKTARNLSAATGLNEERIRRLLRLHEAPRAVKDGVTKGVLVPVLRADGSPQMGETGNERRQHVRLELMAALEFQKLHKHLLTKLRAKAADERVELAIGKALRERWGKERVTAFVKAAIEGKAPTVKDTAALPGFRSTPKQLVLYRERLGSLATGDRQVLREELQALLAQLALTSPNETSIPSAPVPKATSKVTPNPTSNLTSPRV